MTDNETDDVGRFAYDGLDRALHEKARLGILTALVTHPAGLSFADLARLCDLTDGNLSRHLDVLAEAELVKITKAFEGRRPHTTCTLTGHGRKRFRAYLAQLEKILHDAAEEEADVARAVRSKPRAGLAGA